MTAIYYNRLESTSSYVDNGTLCGVIYCVQDFDLSPFLSSTVKRRTILTKSHSLDDLIISQSSMNNECCPYSITECKEDMVDGNTAGVGQWLTSFSVSLSPDQIHPGKRPRAFAFIEHSGNSTVEGLDLSLPFDSPIERRRLPQRFLYWLRSVLSLARQC